MVDADFSEIPVVDLAPMFGGAAERDALGRELQEICHHIGFFVVQNHGVEHELIDDVFSMMQTFFSLPEKQKLLIDKTSSRHFRGWEAVGTEYTNNRPDIREQIDVWTEWPALPADVEDTYLRLLGPNQWMPADVLPGHRELSLQWIDALAELASGLMRLLALGLGLPENHMDKLFGAQPMSLAKFISYPPTPSGGAGVNAHHDAGFLTVLASGETPGLQVENGAGDWIPVPPNKHGFVINLGEMLQGITGNYFVATPHRVVTASPRLSAGYFHGPSLGTTLDVLPLDSRFGEAVATSSRHRSAGFMALREETAAGVGDMESSHKPAVYGEQLWNYFSRSYPEIMAQHYPETRLGASP